jgi:pyruvate,orthophosphate dikinase
MIEIPRAGLQQMRLLLVSEFFSFGTKDLTQDYLGHDQGYAGKFLRLYVELKIYPYDPFQRIDEKGVGKLMVIGVTLGRKTRKDLKIGICGEHGGEPNSVEFCHRIGLDYVSCSPYRVTLAKLAAARAAIKERMGSTEVQD